MLWQETDLKGVFSRSIGENKTYIKMVGDAGLPILRVCFGAPGHTPSLAAEVGPDEKSLIYTIPDAATLEVWVSNTFSVSDADSSSDVIPTFQPSPYANRRRWPTHGANPRWDGDNIIFAKSNLGLSPEIAEHVIKHGPWDVSLEYKKSSYGVDELPQGSDPDDDPTNLQYTGNTENAPGSEEYDGAKEDIANDKSAHSASSGAQKSPLIVPASEVYSDMPATLPNIPPIDYNPRPHEPIAVFRGIPGRDHGSGAKFVFDGWYTVSRINIIAPQSAELVRMQSQKWERRDRFGHLRPVTRTRDTSAWKSSMRHQWAVIKFAKLESGEAPPPPSIERSTGPASSSVPQKSVTEMLQEMRMEDVHVKHAAPEHEPQTDLIEV
ncbi:hypothetical protein E8E14_012023 [Neopestalotiopsis sp. 37M]|nr:hypothetical protein E8E14_012023 [Neopestalotiopsis sp. 37M]